MKVLHVITGLHTGGAETMLCRLLKQVSVSPVEHRVLCLGRCGAVGEQIRDAGVTVDVLNGKGRHSAVRVLWQSVRIARDYQPDLVQGWMYDGNLAAWWLARQCGTKLIWNVRHSVADICCEPFELRQVIRLGAWLSAKADAIIYNSRTAASQHRALGYAADATRILPNGFDPAVFRPDPEARLRIRNELEVPKQALVIGHIARFHPMKDHLGFIQAAGELYRSLSQVRFVLAGAGVDDNNKMLREAAEHEGILEVTHLLGERRDVAALNAAFDIAVSNSAWGEGFSNVIGEAMACGVPCVVTDVGDGRFIVGDTGIVVPPERPAALAEALLQLYREGADGRRTLGIQARARVLENWSLDAVIKQYHLLYHTLLQQKTFLYPS